MNKETILKKATRIEGQADIYIDIENSEIKTARFMVQDFRGFEKFIQGRRVEFVPQLVSRICGLCSNSHQITSLKTIEDALDIQITPSIYSLREIMLLSEWISSHAVSYFFLSMPDFMGSPGGIFELINNHPEITSEAMALRNAGQLINQILGKRPIHSTSMGIGCFLSPPSPEDLNKINMIAMETQNRCLKLIQQIGKAHFEQKNIFFPKGQQVNFFTYSDLDDKQMFYVYNIEGTEILKFHTHWFEKNISEMRADWTLSKFPYLNEFGFPAGLMLVGPLSRSYKSGGIMDDNDIAGFELAQHLHKKAKIHLQSYDACRLLEIYWASKKIQEHIGQINLADLAVDVNLTGSGKGIGVVEAPRGVLIHIYQIENGCLEKMDLTVATQFNNSFINMVIRDIAQMHLSDNTITPEGEKLISQCIRTFDPCLSCATH